MSGCNGNCGSCGGCCRTLELTQQELALLQTFGQLPFQPVGRRAEDDTPLCPGGGQRESLLLRLLERKGLISLDYDRPLAHCREEGYDRLPIRGSAALTARGQRVLEMLELTGLQP